MCLYVISKKTCHAREKARKTPAIDGGREHGPVREYGSSACAQTTSVTTHDGGDLGEGAGPGDRPIGTDARFSVQISAAGAAVSQHHARRFPNIHKTIDRYR